MSTTKKKFFKQFGFWVLLWLGQSAMFSWGRSLDFYLAKNVAIVTFQAVVVYTNLFFFVSLLDRKKLIPYLALSLLLIYLSYASSFFFIDALISVFFPSLTNLSNGSVWPSGFWNILSGSAPYSLALLSSSVYYLLKKNKVGENPHKTSNMTPVNGENILVLKDGKTMYRVPISEILYVEGLREYVNWHTNDRKLITLHSLKKLETELESKGFLRTHKSYIVNSYRVSAIRHNSVEIEGKKVPIGRSYRERVQDYFDSPE